MLGKIWKYLAAAAGVAAGVLYALYRVTSAQKDKAQAKADREEARRKGVEVTRETERRVDKATNQAREKAEEVERENEQQRRSGDRPDSFGDDRLQ